MSAPHDETTAPAAQGETLDARIERLQLEIGMLGRDARADLEAKQAAADLAARRVVDIELAAKKLHDEARRASRRRVTGLAPAPLRPLGDGMH